jgi:hypothetical protein
MPLNMIFKMPIPPPVYWSFVHFLTMQIMPFPPYRAMWLDIGEFGMLYFIGRGVHGSGGAGISIFLTRPAPCGFWKFQPVTRAQRAISVRAQGLRDGFNRCGLSGFFGYCGFFSRSSHLFPPPASLLSFPLSSPPFSSFSLIL